MKKQLIVAASLINIALAASHVQAAEQLELQKIMKTLSKNMQAVTDGISREDWAFVENTSRLIAEHPQPPLPEKMRIIGFIGTNMSKFKAFDEQTHEAASAMATAAQEKNGQNAISSFQKLQLSCLGCHQTFRPGFVEHFYGQAAN